MNVSTLNLTDEEVNDLLVAIGDSLTLTLDLVDDTDDDEERQEVIDYRIRLLSLQTKLENG